METIRDIAAIGTPLVGFMVAVSAWYQWRTARKKLTLDLYDRRYRVFEAARTFLSAIQSDGQFTTRQLFEFDRGTSDSRFLFGADVVCYLGTIRDLAIKMRSARNQYERSQEGDQRDKHIAEESEVLASLTREVHTISEVFAPYLDFSKIR